MNELIANTPVALTPEAQDPAEVARELIRRRQAADSLIKYAEFMDDQYYPYPVHYHIAEKLQAVEQGKLRRLAIFVPPAIGKSRLSSELFPSWFCGRNPTLEFILASYSADLAFGFGRNVRNIIKDERFRLVFPGVKIADDAQSMNEWKTFQGGEYKAEGVLGGLIGFHAHIAVIDDPFKSYESALSLNNRRAVWAWYASVLLNRLRPYQDGPGAVILIMQRWHDDDLGGRIEKLNEAGEEYWDIIRLPSLAEADDPLGRAPGEALLPEGPNMRSVEELHAIRARNPSLFMALHQQKPVSDEGDVFQPGWMKKVPENKIPENLTYYGTSDYALTKGSGDYTVHMIFGIDERGMIYLVEVFREQVEIFDGVESACELMLKYKPLKWLHERVMMSKVVGPLLRKRKAELGCWTVMEDVSVIGRGSKDSVNRAGAIAGAMQMGIFHVPENAEWLGELEHEISRFPNARYDDQIDCLALLGMQLSKLRSAIGATEVLSGPTKVIPSSVTFDEYVMKNTRARRGMPRRNEGIVVPFPEASPLDDNWGLDAS